MFAAAKKGNILWGVVRQEKLVFKGEGSEKKLFSKNI